MENEFWLRDQLFEILGIHDKFTHEYIKAQAQRARNANELKSALADISFPTDHQAIDSFCTHLLDRFAGIKPPKPSELDLWLLEQERKKELAREQEALRDEPQKKVRPNPHNPNENKEQDKQEMLQFHSRMIQKNDKKKDEKFKQIERELQLAQARDLSRQQYLEKRVE